MACELVALTKTPLSRQSLSDLTQRVCDHLGRPISRATVGRILQAAAIKPWQFRYWIFPRDPRFVEKASRVLDLYGGYWDREPLTQEDFILSADEKTSIQARLRCHATQPPGPGRPQRVEHEYARGGALQYLAAWDVRRGYVLGRCEPKTGIAPFVRLVDQAMGREPYCSARRVFWVVDNGSSHRGETSIARLQARHPKAIMVHTPIHASWLNRVEIYFSKVQRKVLTPNDFQSLKEVEYRLHLYEKLCKRKPQPFAWEFTTDKLIDFVRKTVERLKSEPDTLL